MRTEYKRELMESFLWVYPEGGQESCFEEEMIRHNPGEGRLEFFRQYQNGEEAYCYKITGKKALSSIYAALPIRERQLRSVLIQLLDTLATGKEYLLTEEDFLLSPQYMFAEFPEMKLFLCYVPGYGVPVKNQLEGLFEYLLNRVDYEDKVAVELLYDCYMFCVRENGGISELRKRIETGKPEFEKPEIKEPKPVETVQSYKEPEEKISYFSRLSGWLFGKKAKEEQEYLPLVAEEKEEYYAAPEVVEEEEKTVFLSTIQREEVSLLYDRTGEVIPVTKFPFYIGSAKDYVDFTVRGDGISRIHCCITKKGESYYLSDLNSTNGTFLDKKEVIPGRDEILVENSEIRILSEIFYVKFPCH